VSIGRQRLWKVTAIVTTSVRRICYRFSESLPNWGKEDISAVAKTFTGGQGGFP
jgi:hypothetical protein